MDSAHCLVLAPSETEVLSVVTSKPVLVLYIVQNTMMHYMLFFTDDNNV